MQKQVGHTIVQLPQVRQRLATSFQCGDSRESTSSLRRSTVGHLPAHLRCGSARPRRRRPRSRRARPAGAGRASAPRRRPRCRPRRGRSASVAVEAFGQRPGRSPDPQAGPVPIEAQKHSPPGSVQLTRDDEDLSAPARRRSRPGARRRPARGRGRRWRPGRSRAPRGRRTAARARRSASTPSGPHDHTCWRGGCRNCFHDCGPGRMPERGAIVAAAQPVGARRDVDAPAVRQVVGAVELGQHDRVVAQRGPDDAVAPAAAARRPAGANPRRRAPRDRWLPCHHRCPSTGLARGPFGATAKGLKSHPANRSPTRNLTWLASGSCPAAEHSWSSCSAKSTRCSTGWPTPSGEWQPWIVPVAPENHCSAINLVHYWALRQVDLRDLQYRLAVLRAVLAGAQRGPRPGHAAAGVGGDRGDARQRLEPVGAGGGRRRRRGAGCSTAMPPPCSAPPPRTARPASWSRCRPKPPAMPRWYARSSTPGCGSPGSTVPTTTPSRGRRWPPTSAPRRWPPAGRAWWRWTWPDPSCAPARCEPGPQVVRLRPSPQCPAARWSPPGGPG